MDKLTQNILLIGGIGAATWYLITKNKDAKAGVKAPTIEKDAFGMPIIRNELNKIGGVTKKPYMPTITDRDLQILVDEIKNRKAPQTISPSDVNKLQQPNMKPSLGKYEFVSSASFTLTSKFNSMGKPLESKLYEFKSGDVIDVTKLFWDDREKVWNSGIVLDSRNQGVPTILLKKVSDNTATTSPKVTIQKNDGSMQDFRMFSARQPLTLDNLLC